MWAGAGRVPGGASSVVVLAIVRSSDESASLVRSVPVRWRGRRACHTGT
jgi:hypothetical protein